MTEFLPFIVVGLTAGSVYGLTASGLVLTYTTSGIFNFAHGSTAALVAFAFYDLRDRQGLPWPLALGICLGVLSPLVGLLMERIARRLADAPVATKVVATIGLIVAIQQALVIRYGATLTTVDPFLPTNSYRLVGVNVGADQLIVMAIGLAGMLGLTAMMRSRTGRQMRAVVDQPDLLALTGTSPVSVRRRAWIIGSAFAGLSGVLLATTVGLEVTVLSLLVVQAFGAAAIGMFTSIPISYLGGILVGVASALSTKYVAEIPWLNGVPSSMPFLVLFVVLLVAPSRWLVDFTTERKPQARERRSRSVGVRVAGAAVLALAALLVPHVVGTRLPVYTAALAYIVVYLSLALLLRTSGQVSLAQLAFAAVGGAASARLISEAGVPWLVGVLGGALIAVPVGAVLAIPAIRRAGLYLALATFGFAVLLERLVFFTGLMFGSGALRAPRPSFATGDQAYFYVVLAFTVAAIVLVLVLRRSRLGRLLQAMADSPTALVTGGTSVTAIKVIVFCVAAFLAGLGGALLGPVTGRLSPGEFNAFGSLFLIVYLVVIGGSEVRMAVGAAVAFVILPSYSSSDGSSEYLPFAFGAAAVLVSMSHAGMRAPGWLVRVGATTRRRTGPNPLVARLELRPSAELS